MAIHDRFLFSSLVTSSVSFFVSYTFWNVIFVFILSRTAIDVPIQLFNLMIFSLEHLMFYILHICLDQI